MFVYRFPVTIDLRPAVLQVVIYVVDFIIFPRKLAPRAHVLLQPNLLHRIPNVDTYNISISQGQDLHSRRRDISGLAILCHRFKS